MKLLGVIILVGIACYGHAWYALTYCSPITMCDVSCSLEVRDGVVIASDQYAL